jgi:hypothetical protein
MTRQEQIAFLEKTSDFFRCPNSGHVVDGRPGDDKVCCGCCTPNPKTPYREAVHGPVHHVKRYLEPATALEWLAQEDLLRSSLRRSS